jgi:hypothetical protein
VRDSRPAGTGEPDIPVVPPAIQVSTALLLSGHQGVQHVRHWPRRLSQSRLFCPDDPPIFGPPAEERQTGPGGDIMRTGLLLGPSPRHDDRRPPDRPRNLRVRDCAEPPQPVGDETPGRADGPPVERARTVAGSQLEAAIRSRPAFAAGLGHVVVATTGPDHLDRLRTHVRLWLVMELLPIPRGQAGTGSGNLSCVFWGRRGGH